MADALPDTVPAKAGAAGGKPPLFGLSFLDNLGDMTMLRQVGLMVGLAASVAIGFAVVLWSQQPDYRPLYGSLAGMDAKQVMETLAAADIAYTVEPNSGALLVKADDISRARLKLAAAGVTPTDGNIGFEILDKDQGLGTSQFMEPRAIAVVWKANWHAPFPVSITSRAPGFTWRSRKARFLCATSASPALRCWLNSTPGARWSRARCWRLSIWSPPACRS